MLSTCIKHWIIDAGLSKLFDNVTNNFRFGADNKLDKAYRDNLIGELYNVIEGYPTDTILVSDYQLIIDCVKTRCEVTEEAEQYLLMVLSTIKV